MSQRAWRQALPPTDAMQPQPILPPIKCLSTLPELHAGRATAGSDSVVLLPPGLQANFGESQQLLLHNGLKQAHLQLLGVNQVATQRPMAAHIVPGGGLCAATREVNERYLQAAYGIMQHETQQLHLGRMSTGNVLQPGLQVWPAFQPANVPGPVLPPGLLQSLAVGPVLASLLCPANPKAPADDVDATLFRTASATSATSPRGSCHDDGRRSGTPPKKKVRSQTLEASHAREIFMKRPMNQPKNCASRRLAGELAKKYNVANNTIRDIWHRRSWARATKSLWNDLENKSAPGSLTLSDYSEESE